MAVRDFEEEERERYAGMAAMHRGRASEQTFEAEPAETEPADGHAGIGN